MRGGTRTAAETAAAAPATIQPVAHKRQPEPEPEPEPEPQPEPLPQPTQQPYVAPQAQPMFYPQPQSQPQPLPAQPPQPAGAPAAPLMSSSGTCIPASFWPLPLLINRRLRAELRTQFLALVSRTEAMEKQMEEERAERGRLEARVRELESALEDPKVQAPNILLAFRALLDGLAVYVRLCPALACVFRPAPDRPPWRGRALLRHALGRPSMLPPKSLLAGLHKCQR